LTVFILYHIIIRFYHIFWIFYTYSCANILGFWNPLHVCANRICSDGLYCQISIHRI